MLDGTILKVMLSYTEPPMEDMVPELRHGHLRSFVLQEDGVRRVRYG